jgi:drug/metabolite transporter (DMT)-like permease
VPATALVLSLAAALLHASWNLLLARADETEPAAAVALVAGLVVGAPFAVATWDVHAAAIPFVGGASAFQLAYFALLAAAYARADLSLVYPLARGVAPVLVLVVSVVALGVTASAAQVWGIVIVACGVLLVRGIGRDAAAPRGILLALAVAGSIAGYTLLDKHGVAHANALSYIELEMLAPALLYAIAIWRVRGKASLRAACTLTNVVAGVGMWLGYALVLLALQRASAPAVAAVRESSVVIATGLAAIVLHERVTPVRLAGAAAVVGGIALIALG